MPFQVGSIALHDDGQHLGSAKRDVADGVAGLGSAGQLLAPGSDLELTRDGSENIEVVERTSSDIVYRWTRVGANDYECRINCGGVACKMLNDSLLDVVSGLPVLDASGHLLVLAHRIYAARGAGEQVTFRERTSDEWIMRLVRSGANDYEGRLNVGGVERKIITDEIYQVEEYSNHLGAVDNFTQVITAGNGVANTDAANHEMDLSTGTGAMGYAIFSGKATYTPAVKPMLVNLLVQNISDGGGGSRSSYIGFANDWTNPGGSHFAAFVHENDGTWKARSYDGVSLESTNITALSNGDFVTSVVTSSVVYFYVNGALVATHSTNIPSDAMSIGGVVAVMGGPAATARLLSIDLMGVKKWY